jgi:hypothetical protein
MSNNDTFKLDKQFLKELHKRLLKEQKEPFGFKIKTHKSKISEIPSLKHLEEIISGMLWASTQTEEGRLPRFRVAYGPQPVNTEQINVEHISLGFDPFSLKPCTAEELRKLAPAVVPPNGQITVYPFRDELYIQGLQNTDLWGIIFEIVEPARMVIRYPLNVRLAEITGQKSGFIDKNWSNKAGELLFVNKPDNNQPIYAWFLHLYSDIVRETLNQVRLLRHGGTLIFVPDDNLWKKSVEDLVYKCEHRYNGVRRIERSLLALFQSVIKGKDKDEYFKLMTDASIEHFRSQEYTAVASEVARTLAYLTAVDGATILSKNFDVLAFAAKIKEKQKVIRDQKVTKFLPLESAAQPDTSLLTHEFRGKRHLSAARFVINNPDSIVFTVSQDGGITSFVIENGNLLAYKGLELLL